MVGNIFHILITFSGQICALNDYLQIWNPEGIHFLKGPKNCYKGVGHKSQDGGGHKFFMSPIP
jgi:hypothetical protein